MNQTAVLVVVGIACMCVVIVLALLAFFLLNREAKSPDVVPAGVDVSGLSPSSLASFGVQLSSARSNCPRYNQIARSFPSNEKKIIALVQEAVRLKQQTGKVTQKQKDAFAAKMKPVVEEGMALYRELLECPENSYAEYTNKDGSVTRIDIRQQAEKMLQQSSRAVDDLINSL